MLDAKTNAWNEAVSNFELAESVSSRKNLSSQLKRRIRRQFKVYHWWWLIWWVSRGAR